MRRQYWIGVSGTKQRPLANDWRAPSSRWEGAQLAAHMCPRRPTIEVGDRLVMYASGSPRRFGAGRIFAIREVISEPQRSSSERWPWWIALRELVSGPLLDSCPTLAEIDVPATSLRGKAYTRLDADKGRRAEELLRLAGRETLSA